MSLYTEVSGCYDTNTNDRSSKTTTTTNDDRYPHKKFNNNNKSLSGRIDLLV